MIRAALRAAPPGNPFAELAGVAVRRWLGPGASPAELARAQVLVSGSLLPGTGVNYKSWLQRYLDFCERQGLPPLPAAPSTIYRFVVDASAALAASSVRRYLSAIFTLHRDTGHVPPVSRDDPLLSRLLRGHEAEDGSARPRTIGAALPAEAVWAILQAARDAGNDQQLRAAAAIVATFRTVSRSQTTLLAGPTDIWVERLPPAADLACVRCGAADRDAEMVLCDRCDSGYHVGCVGLSEVPQGDWECPACRAPGSFPLSTFESRALAMRAAHAKGRTHRGVAPVCRFSLMGCPDVGDLLERFAAQAATRWLRSAGRARRFFFELPSDPPGAWAPSGLLTRWLQEQLSEVNWPTGQTHFSSHSLRRGAASAASAAGVPRPVVEQWGGWAAGSAALARRYIDASVGPSPAGRAFFFPNPLAP